MCLGGLHLVGLPPFQRPTVQRLRLAQLALLLIRLARLLRTSVSGWSAQWPFPRRPTVQQLPLDQLALLVQKVARL